MVGGADVGRRLGVGGSELAREAHAVLVLVAAHGRWRTVPSSSAGSTVRW
jgi:hypothetical protein